METVTVSIRMEKDLKDRFEKFCHNVGLSMNSAFCVFAAKAARENCIPFEVSLDIPNAETLEAFHEVELMEADPTLGKTYTDVDQMFQELLSDA